jgi:hypothetical protein
MIKKEKQKLGKYQTIWLNGLKGKLKKKYKQGKNQLMEINDSGEKYYCCLGVACDLFKNEVNGKWINDKIKDSIFFKIKGEASWDYKLPSSVRKLLKLRTGLGTSKKTFLNNIRSLTHLNDDYDTKGFSKIIKVIEEDPSLFFMGPA